MIDSEPFVPVTELWVTVAVPISKVSPLTVAVSRIEVLLLDKVILLTSVAAEATFAKETAVPAVAFDAVVGVSKTKFVAVLETVVIALAEVSVPKTVFVAV